MRVLKVTASKYARFITLKRHVKFIWSCASTQFFTAQKYGRLTKNDYYKYSKRGRSK